MHTRIQLIAVPSRRETSTNCSRWPVPCAILAVWAFSGPVLAQHPGVGQSASYVIPGPVDRYLSVRRRRRHHQRQLPGPHVRPEGRRASHHHHHHPGLARQPDGPALRRKHIISGAVNLGPWSQGNWLGGETWWGLYISRPFPNGSIPCDPDFPNANYPDVVFRGGVALTERQGWGAAIDANEFCYPGAYYLHQTSNPNLGLPYQAAAQQFTAVSLAGTGARMGNLVIEGFATPGDQPAIFMYLGLVENCEIRCNHGIGVFMSDVSGNGLTVKNNYIHHNGLSAIYGSGGLVKNNEIAWNNNSRFDPFWGGGGSKFLTDGDGVTIEANHSYRNHGPGLWSDIENIGHEPRRRREIQASRLLFCCCPARRRLLGAGSPDPLRADPVQGTASQVEEAML